MRKSIVRRNLLLSLLFGFLMGIIFPFYSSLFFTFSSLEQMILYTAGCIVAGLLVGLIAFLITKITILRYINIVNRKSSFSNSHVSTESSHLDLKLRKSEDEIGELISGFQKIIDNQQSLNKAVFETAKETKDLGEALETNLNATFKNIEESSQLLSSMEHHAEEEKLLMEETTAAFEELDKIILLNVTHVVELFDNIDKLRTTLQNQSVMLDSILSQLQLIAQDLDTESGNKSNPRIIGQVILDGRLKGLKKFAENLKVIQSVIDEIQNIASNTNTLAINASIEAARMGREGDGFRIIAREVKSLALNTSEASERISDMLMEMEKNNSEENKKTGELVPVFQSGLDKIETTLKNTVESRSRVKNNSDIVITNHDQMRELLGDVKISMQKLKSFSNGTKHIMDTLTGKTNEVLAGMNQLQKIAKTNQEANKDTENSFRKFKSTLDGILPVITAEKSND